MMVTIAGRALPVSRLVSHISSISPVSSSPSPCNVVADTEESVYSSSYSIKNSFPLQEEATGRQPEDLLPAPSSLQDLSFEQQHKLVVFTFLCRFFDSILHHPLFSQ